MLDFRKSFARFARHQNGDRVSDPHQAAFVHDAHDAGAETRLGRLSYKGLQQAFLKPVDEHAGRSQTSQFDDGSGAEAQARAKGQAAQIQSPRRNVFAEVPRADMKSFAGEFIEELGIDEMDLSLIRRRGLPSRDEAMLYQRPGVRIPFNPLVCQQPDLLASRFAEAMTRGATD